MVLSDNGDHPMTRLSDTQLVILGAAAQRADLAVLPLPDTLKLKGGALTKVMDSLRNRGLTRVIGAEGGPQRVVITSEGMAAIGVETEGDEAPAGATEPRRRPRPEPRARARAKPQRPTARPRPPSARLPAGRRPPSPRRPAASRRPLSRPASPRLAPAPSRRS
jgi:hypothetical protein